MRLSAWSIRPYCPFWCFLISIFCICFFYILQVFLKVICISCPYLNLRLNHFIMIGPSSYTTLPSIDNLALRWLDHYCFHFNWIISLLKILLLILTGPICITDTERPPPPCISDCYITVTVSGFSSPCFCSVSFKDLCFFNTVCAKAHLFQWRASFNHLSFCDRYKNVVSQTFKVMWGCIYKCQQGLLWTY